MPKEDRLVSGKAKVMDRDAASIKKMEICNKVQGIEGDDRQGRYYRHPAQLLGFIINKRNKARITLGGTELLQNPVLTNPLLVSSVLNLSIYQRLLPFLEVHPSGITKQEIIDYLETITAISVNTIDRRFSTIVSWAEEIGFLESRDG